jgi:hypothetical protein
MAAFTPFRAVTNGFSLAGSSAWTGFTTRQGKKVLDYQEGPDSTHSRRY